MNDNLYWGDFGNSIIQCKTPAQLRIIMYMLMQLEN